MLSLHNRFYSWELTIFKTFSISTFIFYCDLQIVFHEKHLYSLFPSVKKNHNCSSWVLTFCYNCYSTCSLQRCNLFTALISDISLRTFNLTSSLKIYTFKTSIVYITQYVIHYEKTNRVYVFLFRLYYHYWFVYVQ